MKKVLMSAGGALLLVGASVGGTLFLSGGGEDAAVVGADGEPVLAAARPEKTYYYNVQPEFVVNLRAPSRKQFLMVEFAIATHEEKHLAVIDDNMPELRNELLRLIGRKSSEELEHEEGQLALRTEAREAVDALLAKHHGPMPVDDVFLTRFVMQ